jgi:polyribonucleotide nucleotidyltransferase
MDTKTTGLPVSLLAEALEQAYAARVQILDAMAEAIPYPRTQLSPFAPRMYTIHIDSSKIGTLIGPGGRMVRKLQEEYTVAIDIQDDGTVFVFGVDSDKVDGARKAIEDLTREVQVGEVFEGKVISTMPFGAFVEILPGREGLVHISHLAWEHIGKTEDVARVGDAMQVKVIEVDDEGKIRLSRKELLPRPPRAEGSDEGRDYDRRGPRGGRGDRDRR